MDKVKILSILFSILITDSIAQPVITVYPFQAENLNGIINTALPGTRILFTDGTYPIPGDGYIIISVDSLTLAGYSGDPETVIINGDGMNGGDQGFIINSNNITISNMTIQNVRYNCVSVINNKDGLHLSNCILINAGEFFIDVSVSSSSEDGIIENCKFEYTAGSGVRDYMGGINGKFCKGWIIKNNIFKYIRSPLVGSTAYAILLWNDSEANLVEKNHILDCDRGIGFGLSTLGNSGGIIRNNFIYHRNIIENDQKGITLESSPNTQIFNNTIYFDQDVLSSIEYRFNTSSGIFIANNLTNKPILARDGASATDTNNVTSSFPSWFIDLTTGDLHLSSDTLSEVIDKGMNITGLFDDFDGDSRPQGSGTDIGGDEYLLSTGIDWHNNVLNLPKTFQLKQNYPNPFNPITTIQYSIPNRSIVALKVYDILGNEVAALVNEEKPIGTYEITLTAENLPSGVYFYQLKAGENLSTKKMLLIK